MTRPVVIQCSVENRRYEALLNANGLLKERLARLGRPPTLADVEKSHALFVRATFRPFVNVFSEYMQVQLGGAPQFGGTAEFSIPANGHFLSDIVFHVRLGEVGSAGDTSKLYRYCAYPGIRLFSQVSLVAQKNTVIDTYTSDDVSFVNKFHVPADYRAAWDRGMGQSAVKTAEYYNAGGFTGQMTYRDGLQTPKHVHASEDLWIPLQFWMCGDVSNALPMALMSNAQLKVQVALAPLDQILYVTDAATGAPARGPDSLQIESMDMYVNQLFVDDDVHRMFFERLQYALIRVHRRQAVKSLSTRRGSCPLTNLRFPIEYIHVGVRDSRNRDHPDHWHLFGRAPERPNSAGLHTPAAVWNDTHNMHEIVCMTAVDTTALAPITRSINITTHGVELFPANTPANFFSTYIPQRYAGRSAVTAPTDHDAMLVTFSVYPGKYDPSGYFTGAGNDTILTYDTPGVDASRPAELVVSAIALNFLVSSGSNLHLKFSV
jgi:hypothetical protein